MRIFFVNGARANEKIDFDKSSISIGREIDNDVVISSDGVSRYHALLTKDNSKATWEVKDLNSTNGLKVNNHKINKNLTLNDGDKIEIGEQIITVSQLYNSVKKVVFQPIKENPPTPSYSNVDNNPYENPYENNDEGNIVEEKQQTPQKRSKLFSVLFYTIIFLTAIVVLACILKMLGGFNELSKNEKPQVKQSTPLTLYYSKTVIKQPDNVFFFEMKLENNKVEFVIDDLKSNRHFKRIFKNVNPTDIDILTSSIKESQILSVEESGMNLGNNDINRSINIIHNGKVYELNIEGRDIPKAVKDLEGAISIFAENYGLQTIALPPEELMAQAKAAVTKADDLFANREAGGSNLRDAILRYRQAIVYLEQFSPAPPLLNKARKKLLEAEEIRNSKLEKLEFERVRVNELRDFDAMRNIFIQTMLIADESSTEYDIARQRLFKLDTYLRGNR